MPVLPHLTGLRDLAAPTLVRILDTAAALREQVRSRGDLDLLAGRTVAHLFMEPSTRTRASFEMATGRLGARSLSFSPSSSSSVKGETLRDTARTLRAVGADAIVLRHRHVGAPHGLARTVGIPVINAGDGINEHPTQALLDALTLRDHFGSLEGRTVAIVGDVRHSRVARSNCFALPRLGARVILAGPGTLCPDGMAALGVEVRRSLRDVLHEADAVMMLRIQKERLGAAMIPSDAEYASFFGLDVRRATPSGVVVLHPAPLNRGVEIGSEIADGEASLVFRQMENGVFVRMACLLLALGEA